jgi:hypothetical protein
MPYRNARTVVRPEPVPHVLVLKADGGAELQHNEKTLWASDSDPDFAEAFGGHDIFEDEDVPDLLDYLVEADLLDDDEADDCEIDTEFEDQSDTGGDAIDADFEEVE